MINLNKKIGIFIDSRKKSGGAYQELLYNIKNITQHKHKNNKQHKQHKLQTKQQT